MKNQHGGLKLPLFDLMPSECSVRCQNLIGSYASTHSTFNLIGSCNRNPNTQATKIHTLKPLTYRLFFQNSSINATVHGRLEMRNFSSSVDQHCIFNVSH